MWTRNNKITVKKPWENLTCGGYKQTWKFLKPFYSAVQTEMRLPAWDGSLGSFKVFCTERFTGNSFQENLTRSFCLQKQYVPKRLK